MCSRAPLAQICQHFKVSASALSLLCLGLQHLSYHLPEISLCSPACVRLIRLLRSLAGPQSLYLLKRPGSSQPPQWMHGGFPVLCWLTVTASLCQSPGIVHSFIF